MDGEALEAQRPGTLRFVHPIERLRYVARAGDADATLLAAEAAEALGALGREPRALVPASRRLLEFHPLVAPLWWVCAHVLAAGDPRAAAASCLAELEDDATGDELAGALPAGAVVAMLPSDVVASALAERPDCTAKVVGSHRELRGFFRLLGRGAAGGAAALGFEPEELDEVLDGTTLALVEPLAAGPDGLVLDPLVVELVSRARAHGLPVWVVAGVGRVLAAPLFSALAERAVPEQLLPAGVLDVIVGPSGPAVATVGLRATDCPVPPELLYRPAV
ncbi:MAG: hypothetical protein JWM85_2337 [Acidimicrobiaceae bacterium]|nr:hypothetical protein [Acidimicrobiaceae bacterium]